LYCSHAKQIRKDLDELEEQANATLSAGTAELLPKETGTQQKMTKARLGLIPYISGSKFMQPREALFLSLIVTNRSGERSFSRFKNELKGHSVLGEVVHTKHSVH